MAISSQLFTLLLQMYNRSCRWGTTFVHSIVAELDLSLGWGATVGQSFRQPNAWPPKVRGSRWNGPLYNIVILAMAYTQLWSFYRILKKEKSMNFFFIEFYISSKLWTRGIMYFFFNVFQSSFATQSYEGRKSIYAAEKKINILFSTIKI